MEAEKLTGNSKTLALDVLNGNISKEIKRIIDIIQKEIKGTKFEKRVMEISKDVLEQLYRELWMRRMFWKNAIK